MLTLFWLAALAALEQPSQRAQASQRMLPPDWDAQVDVAPLQEGCVVIMPPLIRPVGEAFREEAARMLEAASAVPMSEPDAARWLGVAPEAGQPLAEAAFADTLRQMRVRRDNAQGWTGADERFFRRMTAAYATGAHRGFQPYLTDTVARRDMAVEGQPVFSGQLCQRELLLHSSFFGGEVPATRPEPTIVFLPEAPGSVDSYMTVSSY